jgi:DNA invertase Pin-like site-specific DNA recombinase
MMNTSSRVSAPRQIAENKNKITALYERLSVDDENATTSNSIINQRQILEDYANKNGFTNIRHFQDDGYSGTRWDRPGWKELIAEVEAGNVQTVITKDMSRVGRDYLQVGFYTEIMFRKHGVRFIAVSNNIDSENQESVEFAPFLNLMSEWYAKDCSRKVKTVLHAKGNSGKHLTSKTIYGYKRSPDDKDLWLVDDEAAVVVKRIFQMTIEGMGSYQIARQLMDEKIEKPSYYYARINNKSCDSRSQYNWSESSINAILARPEYAGHTVNFRTYRDSYKDRKQKLNSKENWKIFTDTHEAIIEQSVFDTVQKLRETPRRFDTIGEANPLTGLLFCADCHSKMYNHRLSAKERVRNNNGSFQRSKTDDSYDCSTYKLNQKRFDSACSGHYIRTSVVRELVLDFIRNVCGYVRENQAEFIKQIREESALQRGETVKSHKKLFIKNERRIAELENLFRKIYEDNANGKLSDKRFEQMSADYEKEQEALERQNAEMKAELEAFNADSEKADSFIGLVKKYTEFEELTTPMLNEFIHKIIVHKAVKNEWCERVQRVDVIFNFIGNFKLPLNDEPTPEELEALQKERLKRKRQREANTRYRMKRKAEYEKKQAEKSA